MANNFPVLDANGVSRTVKAIDNTDVYLACHAIFDSTGTNAASVTASNALKVDGSAVTQPVSGSVSISGTVAATQSGTWNITNVSGTVSLPTGAATAAKQPALGIAGTASSDVITVQGIASMTKLLVTPDANSAINLAQVNGSTVQVGSGTATGAQRVELANNGTGVIATVGAVTAITNALPAGTNNIGDVDVLSVVPGTGATDLGKAIDTATGGTDTGVLALATRDDALSALTPADGDNVQLRTDSTGRLWASANVDQINGVAPSMGNGASGTGVQRVTIANDSTGILATVTNVATIGTSVTPGTSAAHLGKAEDAAHSSGDTGVMALAVSNTALAAFGANGDYTPVAVDLDGAVVARRAPHAAMVRGTASATDTTSTSLIAASGSGSLRTYVTSVQIANIGATTVLVTLQDGSGGTALCRSIAPASGGSNITFEVPIITGLNTALFFAAGGSTTTLYVSAQGYLAP